MKRDMELIREILLAVQYRTDLTPKPLTLEGHDEVVVGRHIEMLSARASSKGRRPDGSTRPMRLFS
ncbi:DUF2513 domain-containing protein [Mesorhizobium sp. M0051]|uniref:hypothetical protein n=1 Tax=unclassified Mesorhizobium TaxID=325217 RepID=UPI003334BA3E